jgi:hypothetical protein
MHHRLRLRRPSPAMLIAIVALVSSFAGPALANQAVDLARKAKLINGSKIKARSIAGSKLKNNTVTGKQVAESSLGQVPKANTANTAGSAATAVTAANAAALNGKSPSAFQAQWALINTDASVLAQSGSISVTKGAGNGRYYIQFPSSLASRPLSVTPVYNLGNDDLLRGAKVVVCGGTAAPGGVTCVGPGTNNVNTAYVEIHSSTNTSTDTPFYIVVSPTGG